MEDTRKTIKISKELHIALKKEALEKEVFLQTLIEEKLSEL